jgi:hypothetical protein
LLPLQSMNRFELLLVVAGALLGGCTTTFQRARPATPEALQEQIVEDAGAGDARRVDTERVTLLYPSPGIEPGQVEPSSEPPAATVEAAGIPSLLDPTQLQGYEVKRRFRGAMEGMLIGALSGATAGAVIGYGQGDDPEGYLSFSAGDKAAMLGVVGAVTGATIGALLGTAIGHKDRYLF